MYGLKQDWVLEPKPRHFVLEDYEGRTPLWCPGCGDNGVLGAVQRLCRDEQLEPENTVVVSGIGCSSRFPHYMKTYGFHSLHGRAFPVACGVRSRRPDLHIFVATGDGDCCAIGTGHWIHAVRYNMNMTAIMFDNNIYGLTKKQTSPTSPLGNKSNTHPSGALLSPLNPLATTMSITNASFVAQTVDWNPAHLYETIKRAHHHEGFSFVRVLQRCPHFMAGRWEQIQGDPNSVLLLEHSSGVQLDDAVARIFKNKQEHDPTNLVEAFRLITQSETVPIGLLYYNPNAEHYDKSTAVGLDMSPAEKIAGIEKEMSRFLI